MGSEGKARQRRETDMFSFAPLSRTFQVIEVRYFFSQSSVSKLSSLRRGGLPACEHVGPATWIPVLRLIWGVGMAEPMRNRRLDSKESPVY